MEVFTKVITKPVLSQVYRLEQFGGDIADVTQLSSITRLSAACCALSRFRHLLILAI